MHARDFPVCTRLIIATSQMCVLLYVERVFEAAQRLAAVLRSSLLWPISARFYYHNRRNWHNKNNGVR